MTDTTDIAAQLAKRILHYADMAELTSEKSSVFGADLIRLTGETITNLLDQFEAERQRADYGQQALDQRNAECDRLINEISALKGDQVPVALIDERQGSGGFCLTQHGRRLNLQHGTELFTAPQKPVVKLAGDMPRAPFNYGMFAKGWNDRGLADKLAIEADGGIVKGGE